MAVDPRKRQKKLEKKRSKEKAKRQEHARRQSMGLGARLDATSAAPILHSLAGGELWTSGIGNVLLSRELNNGNVAFAAFLVDVYCLGVKNAFSGITSRADYESRIYEQIIDRERMVHYKPECVRKLVEGAVRYANDLGLSPHPDYARAKHIFGDLRAEDCTRDFEYGENGKPLFVAGPHDTRDRCREIMAALENSRGLGGYDYILPADLASFDPDDIEMDDEDFEDEED